MAGEKSTRLVGHLRTLIAGRQAGDLSDPELLSRFVQRQDEAAFAAIMERHGGMVLGVCRRVLRDRQDAEDACQAAFLVLARRAGAVRKQASLGSWLHAVAWRVARKLRSSQVRRAAREGAVASNLPSASEPEDVSLRDVLRVLDDELNRMPARYRGPLILCHLEGLSQDEAAARLGCTRGALRGRLERGREQLRIRLLRRGVSASAALVVGALAPSVCSAALPPTLVVATVHASGGASTTLPPHVVALSEAVLREHRWMALASVGSVAAAVLMVAVLAVLGLSAQKGAEPLPGPVRIEERWSRALRLEAPHGLHHAWSVAFSPDGTRLAAGYGGYLPSRGALTIWDVATGQSSVEIDTPRSVRCVAFSPDGRLLATAEHDDACRIRAADTGNVLFQLEGHRSQSDCVCFSADGKLLATASWDATAKLWDPTNGQEVGSFTGPKGQVFGVAIAGGVLACGGADGTAVLRALPDGKTLATLRGHRGVVHWVASAPDGRTLATASWDRTVKLWHGATGKPIATLHGHVDPVLAVAFSPDGNTLASCSGLWGTTGNRPEQPSPSEVILWDLAARKACARLSHDDRVFGVAFSPDGRSLATACWDGGVTVWTRAPAPGASPELDVGRLQFVLAQDEEPPDRDYPQDYHPPLQGAKEISGLLRYSPEAPECVKFEAEGLRLTLPAGYPRQRPGTGVVTDFGVRGDFEATASYEIIADAPAGAAPAALRLVVVPVDAPRPDFWFKPTQNRAIMARETRQFVADATRWNNEDIPRDKWGNEILNDLELHTTQQAPASSAKGRLRLVRHGTTLYFLASEGAAGAFTLLQKYDFGSKDLRNVSILASTGGLKASLDVRVTDLRIRADAFLLQPDMITPVAAPPPTPRRRWLISLIIAALAAIAVLLATGLYLRQSRGGTSVRPPGKGRGAADVTPVVVAVILSSLAHGCRDTAAPPAAAVAALPPDQQIMRELEYYEPVYKIDAAGRVVRLRLGWRHLPPEVLAKINKLTNLVALGLEGTTVTDDGLAQLKDLQSLRSTSLMHTAITDEALPHLEKLRSLQYVWIQRDSVSKEAVERLKQARPDMNLYLLK